MTHYQDFMPLTPVENPYDRGQHGELVASAPRITERSVTVEYTCERCLRPVSAESWTRAAWNKRKGKGARA